MPAGSKPGERRGGRRKGTPNKSTADLKTRLDEYGVDPIEGLAKLAKQAKKEKDTQLEFSCLKTLAEYVAPKRRAIEYTEQTQARDPQDVEADVQEAILEEISKLSASDLIECLPEDTLEQIRGENVEPIKEAG